MTGVQTCALPILHQNLVGYLSIRSIRKADMIVVQNEWMRKACAEKARVDASKIRVLSQTSESLPRIGRFVLSESSRSVFFYPATAKSYKNHELFLEAALILNNNCKYKFSVVMTLVGDETKKIRKIRDQAKSKGLGFEFRRTMSRSAVFDMYTKSILVFPSLLETVGLPLVEAKAAGTIILAYDAEYSRDVLTGYSDAYFFKDAEGLAGLMRECLDGSLKYYRGIDRTIPVGESWASIIQDFVTMTIERDNK